MIRVLLGNIFSLFSSLSGLKYIKENDKNVICKWSLIMSIFKIISMIILQAKTGVITISLNVIRAILVYKGVFNKYIVILFIVINSIVTLQVFNNLLDLTPLVGSSLNNIGFIYIQNGNIKTLRKLRFIGNLLWLNYYVYVLDFTGAIFELLYTVTNIRELLKLREA